MKPQHLDRELEQKIVKDMEKTKGKIEKKEIAEKAQEAAKKIGELKELGFFSKEDMEAALAPQLEKLNKAFEEIRNIKAFLKATAAPSQNSGVLDSPAPQKENPLLAFYNQKKNFISNR